MAERNEMRPREHASALTRLPDRQARRDYLENEVPEKYRELVRAHFMAWWVRRRQQ